MSVHVLPSAVVHTQIHVNIPGVDVVAAGGALDDVGVHAQFHAEPSVGAALVAFAPVAGVPLPVQFQFHDHRLPGAPFALPGRMIEMFVLFPPLTLTMLRSGLVAEAVAPFVWVTVPSVPGLPMRTDTLMFCAPVCVAVAVPFAEPAAGSEAKSPTVFTSGPRLSCVWISCWSTTPLFVTAVCVLVALESWSVWAPPEVATPPTGVEPAFGPAAAPTVFC